MHAVPSMAVLRLLEALAEELSSFQSGEDFNSRLRLSTAGIDVWKLRPFPKKDAGGKNPAQLPLLVLDATPLEVMTNHLTRRHSRRLEVRASVRLPGNVTVVQYAASSNGHAVLGNEWRRQQVADQVAKERQDHPVSNSGQEAVICFRSQRAAMEGLGFAPSQVLTFGSARGSNVLAGVERLHVIGRPMPPGDELIYLAQVLHHDDDNPVSGQLELQRPQYAGQRYEVSVVDFVDPRVSALLHARREDELLQVLHRARLTSIDLQERLTGLGHGHERRRVRLVLHTNHPVPGLRVDKVIMDEPKMELNEVRHRAAETRILAAVDRLQQRAEPLTLTAVAEAASAHKTTVSKVLGQWCIPLNNNIYKGVNRVPKISDVSDRLPPKTPGNLIDAKADEAPESTWWVEEL